MFQNSYAEVAGKHALRVLQPACFYIQILICDSSADKRKKMISL
jgi:hypothetical protein